MKFAFLHKLAKYIISITIHKLRWRLPVCYHLNKTSNLLSLNDGQQNSFMVVCLLACCFFLSFILRILFLFVVSFHFISIVMCLLLFYPFLPLEKMSIFINGTRSTGVWLITQPRLVTFNRYYFTFFQVHYVTFFIFSFHASSKSSIEK